ncbi:hypothetical protein M0813_30203 [Anaeramoeba flamelloides]|uniref:Uncharacterized protein n=1 Tax=Anaeramoeba flamelloides TaxID=1746091 RepID=A0ABQ8XKD3_9EUKA|nr:hypothetical protein M0813_30203 [Anaeramoeba flamelloides]
MSKNRKIYFDHEPILNSLQNDKDPTKYFSLLDKCIELYLVNPQSELLPKTFQTKLVPVSIDILLSRTDFLERHSPKVNDYFQKVICLIIDKFCEEENWIHTLLTLFTKKGPTTQMNNKGNNYSKTFYEKYQPPTNYQTNMKHFQDLSKPQRKKVIKQNNEKENQKEIEIEKEIDEEKEHHKHVNIKEKNSKDLENKKEIVHNFSKEMVNKITEKIMNKKEMELISVFKPNANWGFDKILAPKVRLNYYDINLMFFGKMGGFAKMFTHLLSSEHKIS